MIKKINLAVIFGGQSNEHEVSLLSAQSVVAVLDAEKYDLILIAITRNGNWLIGDQAREYLFQKTEIESNEIKPINFSRGRIFSQKIDLALPIMHCSFGEDGRFQGLLDMFGIPYVFSGSLAHALGMNKIKSKVIAKSIGANVARQIIVENNCNVDDVIKNLDFPIVVKPVASGSSVGVSIAKQIDDLKLGIEEALKHGKEVMLEEYIKGREFTATIIGNDRPSVLAITEIIPLVSDFYDYKAKYKVGGSRHICPAVIEERVKIKMERTSIDIFKAIGCQDLARVDFIWSETNDEAYFIEINTIPGMTATSLVPEAARHAGFEFGEFLDNIIKEAIYRIEKDQD